MVTISVVTTELEDTLGMQRGEARNPVQQLTMDGMTLPNKDLSVPKLS